MTDSNTGFPKVDTYDEDMQKFKRLKRIWRAMKRSRIFQALRKSRLNPYHTTLKSIKAPSAKEAREIARRQNLGYFLYKGIRLSSSPHLPLDKEYEKYGNIIRGNTDVTSRIPRNKTGQFDLFAEEPLVIAVVPVEGPSHIGHTAMQYKNRVVNRRGCKMDDKPLFQTYSNLADYYLIYPRQVGLSPEVIESEMEKAAIRHNKDYDILTNNCACAVFETLQNCGITNINLLGMDNWGITLPTPGNNPFNFGIRPWCEKHGVLIRPEEMRDLYKYNTFACEQTGNKTRLISPTQDFSL